MTTTRPDVFPIASVDATTADFPGRYAGGSHSSLCKPQVTHTQSSLSPMPSRRSGRPGTGTVGCAGGAVTVFCDNDDLSGEFRGNVPMLVKRQELVSSKAR